MSTTIAGISLGVFVAAGAITQGGLFWVSIFVVAVSLSTILLAFFSSLSRKKEEDYTGLISEIEDYRSKAFT
jgi:hypothetical protein